MATSTPQRTITQSRTVEDRAGTSKCVAGEHISSSSSDDERQDVNKEEVRAGEDSVEEDEEQDVPEKGDVVALALPGSTANHPTVQFGKVFRVDYTRQQVRMTTFRKVDKGIYKNEVFGETHRASFADLVHPIDYEYNRGEDLYEIRTPVDLIVKAKRPKKNTLR